MNFMKSTKCFKPLDRWQEYRIFGQWRMRMEIYSTAWTSLRRIMGSSIEIHEVSSAKNTTFSGCHLRGTVHITCWDGGLSKLQTLVCLIWWPFNPTFLSPGHFLIDESLTQLPAADFTDFKCYRLSRWQTYQQQLQQFWQCWSSDYLQSMQKRQRWQRTSPNLKPGDLVLLWDDNTTPLHWPRLSSRKPIQRKMASSVWSHLGSRREFLNVPLHKFAFTAFE